MKENKIKKMKTFIFEHILTHEEQVVVAYDKKSALEELAKLVSDTDEWQELGAQG